MAFRNAEQEKEFNEWWNGQWEYINQGRIQLSDGPSDLWTLAVKSAFRAGISAQASRDQDALNLDTSSTVQSRTGG